jgi:hypothetical protein
LLVLGLASPLDGFGLDARGPMTQPNARLDLVAALPSRPGAPQTLDRTFLQQLVGPKCGGMNRCGAPV